VRLLVINPNTSTFVTDTVVTQARRVASAGTEIAGVTGTRGAPIIGCRTENAIATYEAIELAAVHGEGYDAVLLAVSFDSGLQPLRELLSIPVVGMSESAMLTACMLGGKFSMVTFGRRAVTLYEELVDTYGLTTRFAGIVSMPPLSETELRNPSMIVPQLADEIDRAVGQQGAEAVILAGAVFAGLSGELRARAPVPVVDGIATGVRMAEALVALDFENPGDGSYAAPGRKSLTGVSEELAALYDKLS
jgi:allantoin racemase